MWIKCLPIGILLSSIILFLCGCGETAGSDDTRHTTNYIYYNETDVTVVFEYHYTVEENGAQVEKTENKVITAGESLTEQMIVPGKRTVILVGCNSVRMIFNDAKELWYYNSMEKDKTGNVFNLDNYTHTISSKTEETYTYAITREIYDLASEIEE